MACGDGPVDAIFLAIEQMTGITVVCRDFNVHSVTVGKDAQGEVMVEVEHEGQLYRGRGVSTDSVEASAKAFLNAINRIASSGGGGVRRIRAGIGDRRLVSGISGAGGGWERSFPIPRIHNCPVSLLCGRVAELVDAQDLKSCGG